MTAPPNPPFTWIHLPTARWYARCSTPERQRHEPMHDARPRIIPATILATLITITVPLAFAILFGG